MEKIITKADLVNRPKRTKILTTIGPATHTTADIEKLYENGMTTIRLNFSHGSYDEHGERIASVKDLRKNKHLNINILLDTKGPEIRVGQMKDGAATMHEGKDVTIYCSADDYKNKVCGDDEFTVAADMTKELKVGMPVLVDDGKLETTVKSIDTKNQTLVVVPMNTYSVKTNKRINLPGTKLPMPFLADKDKADIKYGCQQGIDSIASSFTQSADDVNEIRKILKENNLEDVQIYTKIESVLGVQNFDEILAAADGVMIARGDLGLEIPYFDVPYYEQIMIDKCNQAGKPVIVATQMLDGMTYNPAPTRAEVTDVYAAVEWGADATMLSGESAAGDFPFITTQTMSLIDKRAEVEYYKNTEKYQKHLAMARATTKGAEADIANKLTEIAINGQYEYAIVMQPGKTNMDAKLVKTISKFRPNLNTIAVVETERMWTGFGAWSGIDTSIVSSLASVNASVLQQVAKEHNIKSGSKVLVVNGSDITELTIA